MCILFDRFFYINRFQQSKVSVEKNNPVLSKFEKLCNLDKINRGFLAFVQWYTVRNSSINYEFTMNKTKRPKWLIILTNELSIFSLFRVGEIPTPLPQRDQKVGLKIKNVYLRAKILMIVIRKENVKCQERQET